MRVIGLVAAGVGLALLIVWLWWRYEHNLETAAVVEIVSPSASYCPDSAEQAVFSGDRLVSQLRIRVDDCRFLRLSRAAIGENRTVHIKLPEALSFSFIEPPTSQRISLGDLNNDNVIDERDRDIVVASLSAGLNRADVDGDGRTNAIDLSLVNIFQAVGEPRPDLESWGGR